MEGRTDDHCIVVDISRKPSPSKVTKLFLDPTGRHIVVTTDAGDNYYLFHKWRRTKELAKLKVKKKKKERSNFYKEAYVIPTNSWVCVYNIGCGDYINCLE